MARCSPVRAPTKSSCWTPPRGGSSAHFQGWVVIKGVCEPLCTRSPAAGDHAWWLPLLADFHGCRALFSGYE